MKCHKIKLIRNWKKHKGKSAYEHQIIPGIKSLKWNFRGFYKVVSDG